MYAIISLQGKQYRVEEGQRLIVDRLTAPADKPFHPPVLFVGGDGKAEFSPKSAQVTAQVVQDVLGDKIRIGKYKPKSGLRRHTGHRSKLTEVEITAISLKAPAREKAAAEPRRGRGEARGGKEGSGEAQGGCEEARGQEGACEDERGRVMAHKKGLGSSRNGRDSNPKMLGVKIFSGQDVKCRDDHRPPAGHPLQAGLGRGHRPRRHDLRAPRRHRVVPDERRTPHGLRNRLGLVVRPARSGGVRRLQSVASRRSQSRPYCQYGRFLRPCDARSSRAGHPPT